jgi:uncharacterized protein (UPF0276 family)
MGRGGYGKQSLQQAGSLYPLVSHGVSLSLGSVDPLNPAYLDELEDLFAWTHPPWFSDHLCFSSIEGVYFNDLMPLPKTWETVEHVVRRIGTLQERFQRPFLFENISQYLHAPEDELSDAVFITSILKSADCALLLDVNNVYVNSQNHDFNPISFLEQIPLERVVQIHMAGHHQFNEGLVDTHGAAVIEPVWALLEWVLQQARPSGLLLERDTEIPPFEELVPELNRMRALWQKTGQPELPAQKQSALDVSAVYKNSLFYSELSPERVAYGVA